jgi:hypothetical protein
MNLTTAQRSVVRTTLLTAIILFASNLGSRASADTTRELQHALDRLNIRLRQGPYADGWRAYLRLNVLETQAAKGQRADASQLADILNRFSSNAPGLSLPVFNDVRLALGAHLNQLTRIPSSDLYFEIAKARANYSQIPVAQLMCRRDRAVCDLRELQQFYSMHLTNEARAAVYDDLKVDELIAFLEGLQFELPPDVSSGKLADQMNVLKLRQEELEDQLGGLREVEPLRENLNPPQPDDAGGDVPIEPPAPPTSDDQPNSVPKTDTVAVAGNQTPSPQDQNPPPQMSDDEVRQQRARLEKEIQNLQREYDELKKLRDTVREQDAERQQERARVWRELGKFNRDFSAAAKRRGDDFFSASQYSFSKFALLYFYATDDNLQAEYNEYLDKLASELSKLNLPTERDAAAIVGDAVGWLEATDLAPDLVAAIERQYSLPNMRISISNGLVNQLASRPVNDSRPVNEDLFGRWIQGVATSNGTVTIDFVDDPNQAQFSLHLAGNVNSQTYTRERRITAFATAAGSFEVRRMVGLNVGGLLIGLPYGSAALASEFCGVDCRLRLVQRVANKQYEKDKFRNEQESTRRLKNRVINQFYEQSSQTLSQAKNRLNQALTNSIDFGGYLPELYVRTTTDRLWVLAHRSNFQLIDTGRVSNIAAPVIPGGTSVNAQVAVQVHESLLSNYVDPMFTNRTFTNNELAKWAEDLSGEKPEGLATDENSDEEPWSITFDATRPVQFEFANNAFAVTISGRRFSQGDTQIDAGLKIRVPFKIKRINGKLILIRDGDASIDYADPEKKNAKIVAFKSFLETKLNSQKQAESALRKGVELPENLIPFDKVERLNEFPIVRMLQLVELRMLDGWLYIGWNRVPPGTYPSFLTDTPAIWYEYAPPITEYPLLSTQPVPPGYVPAGQTPAYPPMGQIPVYQAPANVPAYQSPYVPGYQGAPALPVYQAPAYGPSYQTPVYGPTN